jgi:hypothetical protein
MSESMITEHPLAGPNIPLVAPAGVPAIPGGVVRPSHLFEIRWDVPPLNWDVPGQIFPGPQVPVLIIPRTRRKSVSHRTRADAERHPPSLRYSQEASGSSDRSVRHSAHKAVGRVSLVKLSPCWSGQIESYTGTVLITVLAARESHQPSRGR